MWVSDNWPAIMEKYKPCNIYNTDKTALFRQLLLGRTLALRNENCHGGKLNKARVTILLTTNIDGSFKLRPLVIGKFKSPICLRGCTPLPVANIFNGKAWMISVLFNKWLRDWDDE